MVDRIQLLASAFPWPPAVRSLGLFLWLFAATLPSPAIPPAQPVAPYVYVPRAHLVDVERAFIGPGIAPVPGAGVRAFRDPEDQTGGTERFEIRWYANPPGIPPGVVVLLESLQERSSVIKNHVLRIDEKSEGHIRSVIEIPAEEVRQAGRVMRWRVRVVWRGRLLASQASRNWDG